MGFGPDSGSGKAEFFDTISGFTCPDGATDTDGDSFGFTVLNINNKGDLLVNVSLKGATANATYDIWVNQDPGACPLVEPSFPGALTTNRQGNGNFHGSLGAVDGATHFWVSAVGGGQVLRSTAVALD